MAVRGKASFSAVLVPSLLLALLVAGWAIDTGVASGQVVRNVELGDHRIGGLTSDDLASQVRDVADAYEDTPVTIHSSGATYTTTAAGIGLSIDQDATVERALDVGRRGFVLTRPFRWLTSLASPQNAPLVFGVDETKAATTIEKLEGRRRTAPLEPTVVAFNNTVVPVKGKPGTGIDPEVLATALEAAAQEGGASAITVSVRPRQLNPTISDREADALADAARELTEPGITLKVGDNSARVEREELQSWLTTKIATNGSLQLVLARSKVQDALRVHFPEVHDPPTNATFTIAGGKPILHPGHQGHICCGPKSGTRILDALERGDRDVTLRIIEGEPSLTTEQAKKLGIVEEIGQPNEFGPTTHHPCCANRVHNIHKIADLVRGTVIRPGDTFSINETIGKRTLEDGWLIDGAIENGVHTTNVGGGISQFGTTLFNAALYAGLDFGEYQSHSLHFDRYPVGHEATLSFPHPDLQIKNTTPFGVLIWPEYTETSLTVHLYSTRFVNVQVDAPSPARAGNCTRWSTPRTRTYPDKSVVHDKVYATYRPAEGVRC